MSTSRTATSILIFLLLVCAQSFTKASAEFDEVAPRGHGLRVFLGYLYDYEPDSTQSRFVEEKLASLGVVSSDRMQLVEYFLELKSEIDVDIEKGTVRMFCGDLARDLHGLELRPVFNALLDFGIATYARYSAIAAADLAGFGYPILVDRLYQDVKDTRGVYVRFEQTGDHEHEYFETERNKICGPTDATPSDGI